MGWLYTARRPPEGRVSPAQLRVLVAVRSYERVVDPLGPTSRELRKFLPLMNPQDIARRLIVKNLVHRYTRQGERMCRLVTTAAGREITDEKPERMTA